MGRGTQVWAAFLKLKAPQPFNTPAAAPRIRKTQSPKLRGPLNISVSVCRRVCMCVCMSLCTCVCRCVCVCVYASIYIYIYGTPPCTYHFPSCTSHRALYTVPTKSCFRQVLDRALLYSRKVAKP